MSHLRLVALLLAISTITTFAQDDFKGGFIIDKTGEYLYGYVRNNPFQFYEKCEFKEDQSSKSITYTPDQINGYGFIPGKAYISYRPASGPSSFLEVVYSSKVILLKDKDNLFIQKGESEISELSPSGNRGNQILMELFSDCAPIKNKAKKSKLTEATVLDLIKDYEQCKELGTDLYVKKIQVILYTGVGQSGLTFQPTQNDLRYLKDGKFKSDFSLSSGFLISYSLYRNTKKKMSLNLYSGLLYAQNQFSRDYETPLSNGAVYSNIIIDYNEVSIPAGIQISLEKKLRPYLRVGSLFQASSAAKSNGTLYTKIGNEVYYDAINEITSIQSKPKFQIGVGISFNITKKIKSSVELNTCQGKGIAEITPYRDINSKFSHSNIQLGIIF